MSRRFALVTFLLIIAMIILSLLFPGLPGAVQQAVIDPADTRTVVGLALSVTAQAPLEAVSYGVFRM